jgi:hydrogenase expression/formation protein HypE
MSKFSLNVLKECVFPYLTVEDPDVILGAVFGEDIALTRIKDGILVSHLDPIIGAVNQIGWLAVHIACNDIATSGARPRWILPLVLVPDKNDHALLQEIMRDVSLGAREIGVSVIGGHTGYSASLARPLVAVTALGTLPPEKTPILSSGARPGDHILVTKGIGLEGTAILAGDFSETAKSLGLTEADLHAAHALIKGVSVIPEALILADHGASAMHDVTRGGLLETLLEMAQVSAVALSINEAAIPIPDVVQRFSIAFQFYPLRMISSGTLVATISEENLPRAAAQLTSEGIPYADIGTVREGQGVDLVGEKGDRHFIESHPEADALARMWEIYPRDDVSGN